MISEISSLLVRLSFSALRSKQQIACCLLCLMLSSLCTSVQVKFAAAPACALGCSNSLSELGAQQMGQAALEWFLLSQGQREGSCTSCAVFVCKCNSGTEAPDYVARKVNVGHVNLVCLFSLAFLEGFCAHT